MRQMFHDLYFNKITIYCYVYILGLQSISRDVADNVCRPRWLDPTKELITYSFVRVVPPIWPPWRQMQTINSNTAIANEC